MGCHGLLQGSLPNPGIEPASLKSLALAGGVFTTGAIWKAPQIPYDPAIIPVLGKYSKETKIVI